MDSKPFLADEYHQAPVLFQFHARLSQDLHQAFFLDKIEKLSSQFLKLSSDFLDKKLSYF